VRVEWSVMDGPSGTRARRPNEPTFRQVVIDDLRTADLRRTFPRDLEELYTFYLTEERRERLASMGPVKRAVWFCVWVVKSLLMHLSPARRVLLLAAFVLLTIGPSSFNIGEYQFGIHTQGLGGLLVLLVLMLELKDKLLAHDEIQVARQVQIALLPRRHPQPAGWSLWSYTRPANDVGGDLIDYLDLDERGLGIALGDVSGKGLGAALLMAKLQATLRAIAPEVPSLERLGARINEILHRDGLENRFATLFYLEILPGSEHLRYLNAGHNPAYLLRAGGIEELAASGTPLGMIGGASYQEALTGMSPGETLLVYSDGVTEALDRDGEEFGTARLKDLLTRLRGLPAEEAGRTLLREVDAFLGDARPHDDLSFVVLARANRA